MDIYDSLLAAIELDSFIAAVLTCLIDLGGGRERFHVLGDGMWFLTTTAREVCGDIKRLLCLVIVHVEHPHRRLLLLDSRFLDRFRFRNRARALGFGDGERIDVFLIGIVGDFDLAATSALWFRDNDIRHGDTAEVERSMECE